VSKKWLGGEKKGGEGVREGRGRIGHKTYNSFRFWGLPSIIISLDKFSCQALNSSLSIPHAQLREGCKLKN